MKLCKHKIFEKIVFTIIIISVILLAFTVSSIPRVREAINNLGGK